MKNLQALKLKKPALLRQLIVFERYFFQRAITWQTELVTMLLVASTFIGSAYVLSEKAHVSMEWIYDFLSKKNIIKLKIFTSFLSLIFFLILFLLIRSSL